MLRSDRWSFVVNEDDIDAAVVVVVVVFVVVVVVWRRNHSLCFHNYH